jgi:hypothetical protein
MSETTPSEWLRDKWHFKFDEFKATMDRSEKECVDLRKIDELLFMLVCVHVSFKKIPSFIVEKGAEGRIISDKYSHSLFFHCLLESFPISSRIMFLSACGLYKNAYHSIRYALESMVQTLYIDSKHPYADRYTKTAILKEVENLSDYHGVRLLKAIEIENKAQIMTEYKNIDDEYKNLSRKVHFTYMQILTTSKDFLEKSLRPTKVDCAEVSKIYDSMRTVYDFFMFLLLNYFPELKEPLAENKEFAKTAKDHKLKLVCKTLNIKTNS